MTGKKNRKQNPRKRLVTNPGPTASEWEETMQGHEMSPEQKEAVELLHTRREEYAREIERLMKRL
jgi:hypothetical protein